jgi:hypothetical protein
MIAVMKVLPAAQLAIANGFAQVDRAGQKLVNAVSGASDDEPATAIGELIAGKTQAQAGLATVRISQEMLDELMKIGQEPEPR